MFRAKALHQELAVGVGEKTTRVFIRVNTKTSRDKIKANQMDFIKTKCKQKNVNHIAKDMKCASFPNLALSTPPSWH